MTIDQKISDLDPELSAAVAAELRRQEEHIELIASENYASAGVMALQGSVLTNKYAEGYPSRRYYGGCDNVDVAENLAIDRAKKLFSADFANVQAHSGSQANMAVYMSLLEPGDTILGMSLAEGGHLTHGHPVNFSGKLYNFFGYGLDNKTGLIDYQRLASLAKEQQPKMIVGGFSAYSRIADWDKFRQIADSVDAYLMVDMAHVAGLVAAGCYPNPVPIADVTTSTTHKTLRGPRGGLILGRANRDIEKSINKQIFPGTQGGPLMHVIAAKAFAFLEAMHPDFVGYQKQVIANAKLMAKLFIESGFNIVSGGTDSHLFLLDLTDKNITGADAEKILGQANITLNKNSVPNDERPPMITSGLRIGTPAITTRGFKESEVSELVELIITILADIENQDQILLVKNQVQKLCKQFPVYNLI
ncbi:MAG: serine hydroxymethyltransferase [Gammaproteobacteria bacterium]|nr:serine hydroxymethyltransferase [Gammaproteobacteria bacterium]|tara:strand:- start:4858 stop:6114 length:1257 start_codon:yes stop_codon:yes gene_type:complete